MSDKRQEISILAENVTVQYRHSNYNYHSFKEYCMQRFKGKIRETTIRALDGVNIKVLKGESVALIGHNGSGKSTLLRVLAGVIEPPKARIEINGRVAPMIELSTGFDGELSGYENIILSCSLMGLTSTEINSRIDDIITFSELRPFIHMPFKNYSSGMQARLGFSCTTAVDPDILLVDEVLAVGDSNFARKCLQRIQALRAQGTTVVLVSHDPSVVKSFCDRAYVLDKGRIVFEGGVDDSLAAHEELMEKRYIANLTEVAMGEYYQEDNKDAHHSLLIPKVRVQFSAVQNHKECRTIDLAKPFALRFKLDIENPEYFNGKITAGIGINSSDDHRITGVNNTHLNLEINSIMQQGGKFNVDFRFSDGIRHLCSGIYKIIFGLHDNNLLRTIFCHDVGFIEAFNSALGLNSDRDICDVSESLDTIEIYPRESHSINKSKSIGSLTNEVLP